MGFAGGDLRSPDLVQETRLAMVDMAEHGRHHRALREVLALPLFKLLADVIFLRRFALNDQLDPKLQG